MTSNMDLAAANNMSYDQLKEIGWYDHHLLLEKTRAKSRKKTPQADDNW